MLWVIGKMNPQHKKVDNIHFPLRNNLKFNLIKLLYFTIIFVGNCGRAGSFSFE